MKEVRTDVSDNLFYMQGLLKLQQPGKFCTHPEPERLGRQIVSPDPSGRLSAFISTSTRLEHPSHPVNDQGLGMDSSIRAKGERISIL